MEFKTTLNAVLVTDGGDQVRIFASEADFLALGITPSDGGKALEVKLNATAAFKLARVLMNFFDTQNTGKR